MVSLGSTTVKCLIWDDKSFFIVDKKITDGNN